MERVKILVTLDRKPLKKFGAHIERANGQIIPVASGKRGSQFAKEKAEKAVRDCEWEPLFLDPTGRILDLGHGWIDDPEPISAL